MNCESDLTLLTSSPRTLLLVEDEPLLRALLSEVLREAEFAVVEADDGNEAMHALDHQRPQILVTDIELPGSLDGLAIARRARAHSLSLAIILISGRARPPVNLMPAKSKFLAKPFLPSRLIGVIASLTAG